jgi:hypothetical protein
LHIKTTWLEDNQGLHREYIGNISITDIVEATLILHENPLFNSLHYIIEDYTNATNPTFDAPKLKPFSDFVSMRSNTKENLMVAIVSHNTPESLAAAHAFCEQMLGSHYNCRVFHSLETASDWARASESLSA